MNEWKDAWRAKFVMKHDFHKGGVDTAGMTPIKAAVSAKFEAVVVNVIRAVETAPRFISNCIVV